MIDWYNITAINASGVLPLVQTVRELYFNPLGDMMLMVIFFVSFISFNHFNNNPKLNLMFASFAIAVFSLFFRVFNIISDYTPFLTWGMFGLSIAIVTLTK